MGAFRAPADRSLQPHRPHRSARPPGIPSSFGGPGGFGAAHGPGSGGATEGPEHDAAGAYVLGILDETEASAFEEHLAGCALCAAHLDEFAYMEPMLAMLAEAPAAVPGARPVPHVPEPPAPGCSTGWSTRSRPDGPGGGGAACIWWRPPRR